LHDCAAHTNTEFGGLQADTGGVRAGSGLHRPLRASTADAD